MNGTPRGAHTAAPAWALALVALALVLACVALSPPGKNDLIGGDEGYYGIMARNLLASRAQWASPSLVPLGPPGDKPPGEPMLVALAIRALGPTATAVRLPSLLAALVTLLASALLARRLAGAPAAWCALLLLGTLPWFADASRMAAAELPLTALGLLALLALPLGPVNARRAVLAGALFGLAFLCKLWLVALLVVPALLQLPRARLGRGLAALAAGFALPLAAYLALVVASGPGALAHVLNVGFGFSLLTRASGAGYAAYWLQGPFFYAGILAHAFALAAPLVVLGAVCAVAEVRTPGARSLLGAVGGLVLISLFRVKGGGYLHPLVPQFALLASFGFAWLHGRARPLALLLAAVAVLGGAVRTAQRLPEPVHDTGYRAVATALAPYLAARPGAPVSLLAPEWPSFAFHTFRRADYWGTPYRPWTAARRAELATGDTLRAFVVDTSRTFYGGWPDDATLAWLVAHTREITAQVPGAARHPLRVFVRE